MRTITKLLLVTVLVLAAACARSPQRGHGGYGGAGGGGGGYVGGAVPQLGDSRPHVWRNGHPYNHQVHGIDISRWQGQIDWGRLRASGVSFAFIKATEGADHSDPAFLRYWREAGAARMPRGAYHYYYFCRSGAEQAAWFIRNVPRERGALPPVLDLEWTHSRTCPRRPPAAEIKREASIFMQILGQHYGQRPIIYTTVDFYRDNRLGDMRAEFWLRSVADHPSATYPGQRWTFWQYTGTGTAPGIAGNVDLNVFAGNAAQWAQWLRTHLSR